MQVQSSSIRTPCPSRNRKLDPYSQAPTNEYGASPYSYKDIWNTFTDCPKPRKGQEAILSALCLMAISCRGIFWRRQYLASFLWWSAYHISEKVDISCNTCRSAAAFYGSHKIFSAMLSTLSISKLGSRTVILQLPHKMNQLSGISGRKGDSCLAVDLEYLIAADTSINLGLTNCLSRQFFFCYAKRGDVQSVGKYGGAVWNLMTLFDIWWEFLTVFQIQNTLASLSLCWSLSNKSSQMLDSPWVGLSSTRDFSSPFFVNETPPHSFRWLASGVLEMSATSKICCHDHDKRHHVSLHTHSPVFMIIWGQHNDSGSSQQISH